MRPASHLVSAVALSAGVYQWTGDVTFTAVSAVSTCLLDLDHAIEHVLQSHRPFSLKTFLHPLNSLHWKRVFFFLHSYEILLLLMVAAYFFKEPLLWAVVVGVGFHLLLDEIGNRLPCSPAPVAPLFYFLTYRWICGFKPKQILSPREETEMPYALNWTGPSVVIGSSQGLGAAFVNQLLKQQSSLVVGVSRTRFEDLACKDAWERSGRYIHVQADIGERETVNRLKEILPQLPGGRLLLIYNPALFDVDIVDQKISFKEYERVTRVGVDGLMHALMAFQDQMHKRGGLIVGTSSINALRPATKVALAAYPASKAHMSMLFRCLNEVRAPQVKAMTFHLGLVGRDERTNKGFVAKMMVPTYDQAARRILKAANQPSPPKQKIYPLPYKLAYGGVMKLVPDCFFNAMVALCAKIFWTFIGKKQTPG